MPTYDLRLEMATGLEILSSTESLRLRGLRASASVMPRILLLRLAEDQSVDPTRQLLHQRLRSGGPRNLLP